MPVSEIPRPEKILISMYQLSAGTSKPLEYEDIVVAAWKLFPEDFGLRKYVRDYPDASDIHKPLYGPLKSRGFVLSGNKKFKLTEKGIAYASKLDKVRQGLLPLDQVIAPASTIDRLSRDKEAELKRISETEAFKLFAAGEKEKILDTDFYIYLGTTVRTEKNEFLGRLNAVGDAVADAARISPSPRYRLIIELHNFIREKFAPIIERNKGKL
jgi:hypothetical protein